VDALVRAALAAADPAACVRRALSQTAAAEAGPVLAIGKAAARMLAAFAEIAGAPIPSLAVVPRGTDAPAESLRAAHPVPDASSVHAAERAQRFASEARAHGRPLTLLLSGGASALIAAPAPGITIDDYAGITAALLRAGAGIAALNTVRRHIDRLKGGKLGLLLHPLPVRALVLSDVIGDTPHDIGSGPVSGDPTTYADAIAVLRRHAVRNDAIERHLADRLSGRTPENPRPGDPRLENIRYQIIGSNTLALRAAADEARRLGLRTSVGVSTETGAASLGRDLARAALRLAPGHALLWGGESVVNVGDAAGVGGRNQELALAAAIEIDGRHGITLASFGTDGVDGPTDAAGAAVTGETCGLARALGFDAAAALARHDSHTFFAALDRAGRPHLIRTGPTGTNVNDVVVAFRA
jgi:hydroxypyruvate reductase